MLGAGCQWPGVIDSEIAMADSTFVPRQKGELSGWIILPESD